MPQSSYEKKLEKLKDRRERIFRAWIFEGKSLRDIGREEVNPITGKDVTATSIRRVVDRYIFDLSKSYGMSTNTEEDIQKIIERYRSEKALS